MNEALEETDGRMQVAGRLLTDVAVVQPDPTAVIFTVAFHGVVGEVALGHFVIWIDDNLKGRGKETILRHAKEQWRQI